MLYAAGCSIGSYGKAGQQSQAYTGIIRLMLDVRAANLLYSTQ